MIGPFHPQSPLFHPINLKRYETAKYPIGRSVSAVMQ